MIIFLIVAIVAFIGFVASLVAAWFIFRYSREQLYKSLKMRTFLVQIQKESTTATEEVRKSPKEIIALADQFFASLSGFEHGLKGPFLYGKENLVFEIAANHREIRFYIAVPERVKASVEKQIHAIYPKASIEEGEEYTIFDKESIVHGGFLKFEKKDYLPIMTYQKLEADPLNSITNALSKLQEGESAVIQYVLRPANNKWRTHGTRIAKEMTKKGADFHEAKKGMGGKFLKEVSKVGGSAMRDAMALGRKDAQPRQPEQYQQPLLTPYQQQLVEALEGKAAKTGYETNIRVIAAAPTDERAETVLHEVRSAFDQFGAPDLNNFKLRKPKRNKNLILDFVFRYFRKSQQMILNTEELATIFHFPNQFIETPNIKWLGARTAPAPSNMPTEGILLGVNKYRGAEKEVHLAADDRRRHLYLIGKTGTGKTTLLLNMVEEDIKAGAGFCVVEPHGDFIEDILSIIPKERAEDVILFDPGDIERPMGLNLLEFKTSDQRDFAVNEMIAIFHKLFPPEITGPIFEHNMRNVMLTLMADPEDVGTIADIPRMFTDEGYVRYRLRKVTDPIVRAFWEKEMAKTSDFHKSEALGYMVSKVGQFVENSLMRNIIGQKKSAFDIRQIMDEGKILLVNLSKGRVGEVNSSLLGLLIVSKIQMAALSRAEIKDESQRRDFHLYLDEFQNVTTDSIEIILSEARKYHLTLNIAHQFIAQLEDNIRDAVFGNVGTMISYRIGAADSEFVEKEFQPVFSANDLMNLNNHNAVIKEIIDGTPSRPFSMEVLPPLKIRDPKKVNRKMAELVRQLSAIKYGRDRVIVEREIAQQQNLSA